ncbi:hypothetical protein KA005_16355, partial [bacterium]|nr:hypothetical protein [bacterium]
PGEATIWPEVITDLRRSGLAVLSKELTIKDGNVGIGTTNPTGKLQIDAPAFADSKLKIGGIYGAGDGYAHHISSARDIVFNSQQGNWPDLRSSGFYFRRSRFDDLDSYVDLVHITLDGKVGIGTNSHPSERLTVEGNICATGRIIGNNLVVEAQIDDIDSQGASWGSDVPWSPVPKMEAGYTISIQQKTMVFFRFNIDMLEFYYPQGAGYVDFRILFNDREQVKKTFAVPEPGLSQIENIVLDGFTMLKQSTEIKLEWRVVQILLPGGNLASHVTLHSRTLNVFAL